MGPLDKAADCLQSCLWTWLLDGLGTHVIALSLALFLATSPFALGWGHWAEPGPGSLLVLSVFSLPASVPHRQGDNLYWVTLAPWPWRSSQPPAPWLFLSASIYVMIHEEMLNTYLVSNSAVIKTLNTCFNNHRIIEKWVLKEPWEVI